MFFLFIRRWKLKDGKEFHVHAKKGNIFVKATIVKRLKVKAEVMTCCTSSFMYIYVRKERDTSEEESTEHSYQKRSQTSKVQTVPPSPPLSAVHSPANQRRVKRTGPAISTVNG